MVANEIDSGRLWKKSDLIYSAIKKPKYKKKFNEIKFIPYLIYVQNDQKINNFYELTNISYDLTQQLLFKYPKNKLPKLKIPQFEKNTLSYHMGDLNAESVRKICEWVSISTYSKKTQLPQKQIIKNIEEEKYGKILIHPTSNKPYLIWPPEMQSLPESELPEFGKKIFAVSFSLTAKASFDLNLKDINNFEEVQKQYLALAHSVGKPEELTKRSNEIVNQSCFLLRWTIFEVFLKSTIKELIFRHPHKIVERSKAKKSLINYEQVLEMSENFSSIIKLRECLVQREIDQMQSDGESIHGLINYLKSAFQFTQDPYEAWYILDGERKTTHYNDLMEIKDVRNALIHDSGMLSEDLLSRYENIPRSDNQIIITNDYYQKTELILSSIAFSIAYCIEHGHYNSGK